MGQRAEDRFTHSDEVDESELAAMHEHVAHLQHALQTRAAIEQAKGVLMFRFDLDADGAFALLTRWSQQHNIKLHDVALHVLDWVASPNRSTTPIDAIHRASTTRVSRDVTTPFAPLRLVRTDSDD